MIARSERTDLAIDDRNKQSVKFIAAAVCVSETNRDRAQNRLPMQESSLRSGRGQDMTSPREIFVSFSPGTASAMRQIGRVWRTDSKGIRLIASFTGSRLPPPIGLTGPLPSHHEQEQCENYYGQLGWWKGPFAAAEVRNSTREFWLKKGAAGAEWLINRIGNETQSDAMDAVANLLADFGIKAIDPIVRKLQNKPTSDQSEVLLKALGWIEGTEDAVPVDPDLREKTLAEYFLVQDPDVRAAAYAATRILPRERAISLLRGRTGIENDAFAVGALEEALEARI
jgi:hypothetical protein